MFDTISLPSLARVTGGRCGCGQSHADQLKNGNGGIVPKLPQRSHADELANGGIVPKLPPLSHADQLRNGNGGIVPKL